MTVFIEELREEAMRLSPIFGVFPTARNAKKPSASIPRNSDGSYRHNAFRAEATGSYEAASLFARRDVGGIGVWCGGPGDVYCLDFDEADYLDHWCEECSERGLDAILARLAIVKTPGGFHAWAQVPDHKPRTTVLAYRPAPEPDANRGRESGVRIEVRGSNAYAIVPVSPGYEYRHRHLLDTEPLTPAEWERLTGAARVFCEKPEGAYR